MSVQNDCTRVTRPYKDATDYPTIYPSRNLTIKEMSFPKNQKIEGVEWYVEYKNRICPHGS